MTYAKLLLAALVLAACEPNTEPGPLKPADLPRLPPGPDGIYVANADGSEARHLVDGDWPAWSPDGLRIAFHRSDSIRMISTDGSGEMVLGPGREPAWSPDGTRLAFRGAEGLTIMRTDGSDVRTLVRHDFRDGTVAEADMGVGAPAWSPDGARIAFEHRGDGDIAPMRVYMTTIGDPYPAPLSNPGSGVGAEGSPAWSPDGSRLAVWSYGVGIASVPDSGGVRDPFHAGRSALEHLSRPVWSPKGDVILFTVRDLSSTQRTSLWTVDLDGNSRGLIAGAKHGSWSPDGDRVVLVRAD